MPKAPEPLAFRIHGMDCAEEVAVLKSALKPLVDASLLRFDVLSGKLIVDTPTGALSPQQVLEAVARTGMRAEMWRDTSPIGEVTFWQRQGRMILTVGSGVLGSLGLLSHVGLAGGVADAFGSEGMGISNAVPP